jgi:hypothetical protein
MTGVPLEAVQHVAAVSYAAAICKCCFAVSSIRSEFRLAVKECLALTEAFLVDPRIGSDLRSDHVIVPLGSTDHVCETTVCAAKTGLATSLPSPAKIFLLTMQSALVAATTYSLACSRLLAEQVWSVLLQQTLVFLLGPEPFRLARGLPTLLGLRSCNRQIWAASRL